MGHAEPLFRKKLRGIKIQRTGCRSVTPVEEKKLFYPFVFPALPVVCDTLFSSYFKISDLS
jgi:hypothetical protein